MNLVIIFLSIVYSVCQSVDPIPRVKLPLGTIEGFVKKSVTGRQFLAFEGIPYARPPVGKYRFEKAIPPEPWTGVWKATTMFKCMQYYHFTPFQEDMILGDEDCLYVNVYTPDINPKKKFNVLVFIHGGAFMFNWGGVYGPEIVLNRDIVYVNFNYRLGTLGFLSTEDNYIPGNMGLRDQILALKWIKRNIEHFGGDPKSITISGMSAGGASVQFHYLFRESQDLFNKGISQSGSVLNPWVLMEKPLEKTKRVASIVGCSTDDNKVMVSCLKKKPARQLVESVKHLQPYLYNPFSPFAAVVDSWARDPLLPEHPYKLLLSKKVQDLPWFISYVSAEGLYPGEDFFTDYQLEYIEKNWNKVVPYILHYEDTVPENLLDSISQKIRDEYMEGKKLTKDTFHLFIQAISDRLFIDDIEVAARLHNSAVKSPVFSYYFDHRGAQRKSQPYPDTVGISHADDTPYILKTEMDTQTSDDDKEMSRIMTDMFVSFMETSKPNITADWRPLSKDKSTWVQLHISNPKEMFLEEVDGNLGRRNFWKSLGLDENANLLKLHDEL